MCVLMGVCVWVQVEMHALAVEVIVVTADKGVYNHHMAQQVSSMQAVDVEQYLGHTGVYLCVLQAEPWRRSDSLLVCVMAIVMCVYVLCVFDSSI